MKDWFFTVVMVSTIIFCIYLIDMCSWISLLSLPIFMVLTLILHHVYKPKFDICDKCHKTKYPKVTGYSNRIQCDCGAKFIQ